MTEHRSTDHHRNDGPASIGGRPRSEWRVGDPGHSAERCLRALTRGLRRWPANRALSSATYRLAARLGGLQVGTLSSGEPMWLDLSDFVQRHIYMCGTYEESATRYVQRRAMPSWTFVDVGACEGYYAVLAVALGGPQSRVVAIEPNPTVARQLRRTLELGGYPIELLEVGCGSSPGTLPLTISDAEGNIGMSSFARHDRGATTEVVPVTTLDAVCAERNLKPDVVKIDVEGFEAEVLGGFATVLRGSPPELLLVELAPKSPSHAEAFGLLSAFGYQARRILHDGTGVPMASADELAHVDLVAFERG